MESNFKIGLVLENYGLDSKEIEVYFASLSLGESNIVPIAKKVGIPRNTAVYSLEKLQQKGLVDILLRGSRHVYAPKSPKAIVEIIKKQKSQAEKDLATVEEQMPALNKMYAVPHQPQVRFYRGQSELRQSYDHILEQPIDDIYYVGEYDSIIEVLGAHWAKDWIQRRIAKNIRTTSIRVRSKEVYGPLYQSPKETNRKIRYAPTDFKSPGHIQIYGDEVMIMTTAKENFCTVITSREYATMMLNWFKQLWKVSGE